MTDTNTQTTAAHATPLFEGTLFLSPHLDYFQNGDDFFVYHNIYGYIIQMSEDLVDFLEYFHPCPRTADEVMAQFDNIFDRDTLNNFLSVFRPLACILPDDEFEPAKTHDMYPTTARWITVDETSPDAVVIYTFDTQSKNSLLKISLDKWESHLWSFIQGNKTVGEIAAIMAEEENADAADVESRIQATLSLWSHCSVQAVKLSADVVRSSKNARFGIPPYLISTMPYPRVTADVRTVVDDAGNVVDPWTDPERPMPKSLEIIHLDDEAMALDRACARLSSLLAQPHDVLKGRAYGQAVFDVMHNYAAISGDTCRVLDIGGNADTVRAFINACSQNSPQTAIDYTLFVTSEEIEKSLHHDLDDLANLRILCGDIEKIADLLEGEKFNVIYSDEFLANLPSVNVRKMSMDGSDDEDDEDRPDDGELKPAHAADNNKVTFIGEGDAVQLIFKYRLNLCDAPEDFILNAGSLRLLGNVAKLADFNTQIFFIEFGEDIKYPVQTIEDGKVTYSQHFGILKQAAKKLGFMADSRYWMEELDLDRDLKMFATTRSQFKALRQMLSEHGVSLERRPYSQQEFAALLEKAGRKKVVEVNYEPAEDRISGLVSHAYKMLRIYKDFEF